MLIPGGLIAIAVLALLGAFFLARGEKKAEPAKVASASVKPEAPVQQPELDKKATIPAPELKQPDQSQNQDEQLDFPEQATFAAASQDSTMGMPEINSSPKSMLFEQPTDYWGQDQANPRTGHDVASLNRRLYELAGQLHILQRQSRDIEQGLIHLSGVIEHMQSQKNNSHPLANRNQSIPSMPYGE
ncbi:hypothetical protein KDW_18660 [Dictyobacter vulcani]|uniref:Uncharacterized protein n=1 Tax=Dictyobacter vulcani TaxID=2607529 RepID=A0A5J4KEK9_9CHLR|nr:hypothetical protein [Dictyobacter vulcani]GER87704.1 hypothetical protein KDW_18660 [Dictyobacter vulcani]